MEVLIITQLCFFSEIGDLETETVQKTWSNFFDFMC
jgi:hypothetical protein